MTRFRRFTWSEHPELARALQEAREKLAGFPLPKRFKVKL